MNSALNGARMLPVVPGISGAVQRAVMASKSRRCEPVDDAHTGRYQVRHAARSRSLEST